MISWVQCDFISGSHMFFPVCWNILQSLASHFLTWGEISPRASINNNDDFSGCNTNRLARHHSSISLRVVSTFSSSSSLDLATTKALLSSAYWIKLAQLSWDYKSWVAISKDDILYNKGLRHEPCWRPNSTLQLDDLNLLPNDCKGKFSTNWFLPCK
jgi:hypothetical protein